MKHVLKRMQHNLSPTPIRPAIYHQFRGCKWKYRYASEENAAAAVKKIKQNGADSDPNRILVHYKCDLCFGWHVGHKNPPAAPVNISAPSTDSFEREKQLCTANATSTSPRA